MTTPKFFTSATTFRSWLEKNHATKDELWVGLYKKASGRGGLTYKEAVDQALCFGWIDGVVNTIDDKSYMQRFTPRRARSNWSSVNIGRVQELAEQGLMAPAGLAAFEKRTEDRSNVYSYERRHEAKLSPAQEKSLRSNKAAWEYFRSKSPSYRQTTIWWIVSAKREETQERRLLALIEQSESHQEVGPMRRRPES